MRKYDLVMTHNLDADDFFIHRVQQHCAERGLNFFLIDPLWVTEFLDKLRSGKVWSRVLLNMHSEHHRPEDVFHQLVRLAFERNCRVIDPPDVALAAFNKALLHPRLEMAGFKVPFTRIVAREHIAELSLSETDLEHLRMPFVIKPSLGYGKGGVIMDALSVKDLGRAVKEWPDSNYLVQRRMVPRLMDDRPAYFRVFFAFRSVWSCWWNCYTDQYQRVAIQEVETYGLKPLREIVCRLAELTGMSFFSTEIALVESGEFVLIDYMNDQCHMLTQSANPKIGVPDEIVSSIARRLVEGAQQLMREPSSVP